MTREQIILALIGAVAGILITALYNTRVYIPRMFAARAAADDLKNVATGDAIDADRFMRQMVLDAHTRANSHEKQLFELNAQVSNLKFTILEQAAEIRELKRGKEGDTLVITNLRSDIATLLELVQKLTDEVQGLRQFIEASGIKPPTEAEVPKTKATGIT